MNQRARDDETRQAGMHARHCFGDVVPSIEADDELAWSDPPGDRDPIVQAARSDVSTGIASGMKPGPAWRPQGVRPYAPYASRGGR